MSAVLLVGLMAGQPAPAAPAMTWDACVAAVWASGEPTDANFQACDARYPLS